MKIGILQTGHVPDDLRRSHGEFADMFARFLDGKGFEFATWNVVDDEFPQSTDDADGWLVTGSKHSVYDGHPWIGRLTEFLRRCYSDEAPVVGVCFGHQALAAALGGRVEKFEGGWSVGRNEYDVGGARKALNAWHQDQVVEPPPDAEVAGSSDFCKYAMLTYGRRAMSIQPHPEFNSGFVEALIDARGRGTVPDGLLARARSELDQPVDSEEYASLIAEFFRSAAVSRAKPESGGDST